MGTASKLHRDRKHPQTRTGPVGVMQLGEAQWDALHGNRHARRRAAVTLRRHEKYERKQIENYEIHLPE